MDPVDEQLSQLRQGPIGLTPAIGHLIQGAFHRGEPTLAIEDGSTADSAAALMEGAEIATDSTARIQGTDVLTDATAWLCEAGFPACAQSDFAPLHTHPDATFANLLCLSALATVPREELISAVFSLSRLLRPDGRMLLGWPVDGAGPPMAPGRLSLLLESVGLQVVQRQRADPGWLVLLAQKSPLQASGLERIQHVLVQDKKDATYKFALMRALCEISRTQASAVRWGDGEVFVPLWAIAVRWLTYYWPLLTGGGYIAQKRGEAPGCRKPIAFRSMVRNLAGAYGDGGLYAVHKALDERPGQFRDGLKLIAHTIRYGPVFYSGTVGPKLFRYAREAPGGERGESEAQQLGWVVVKEPIWLDISRFDHWIEDSLILRWAQLTADMNQGSSAAQFVPLLLAGPASERDTSEVRSLLMAWDGELECVWSGEPIRREFAVDHLLPYSVWRNNDLWNLLPSLPRVNAQKSDALPTRRLLLERREAIVRYWRVYFEFMPTRFGRQVGRALGQTVGGTGWERVAFTGLQETVERLAMSRGLGRWG